MKILIVTHSHFSDAMVVGSHHLARQYARAGHHVLHLSYPVSAAHLVRCGDARMRARFVKALDRPRLVEPSLYEWLPLTLFPWEIARSWRRWSGQNVAPPARWRVRQAARRCLGGDPDVVFVEDPRMAGIERSFRDVRVCYRVTDLHAEMRDDTSLRETEDALLTRVSRVIATSTAVRDALAERSGRSDIAVIENGFDDEHFALASSARGAERRPSREAVYVGALDFRFDFATLERIAQANPDVMFTIYGATGEIPAMSSLANLRFPGPAPYRELPSILARADVALMPFLDVPANHARSPMKLFEYLSTGLPVVAYRCRALADYAPRGAVEFYDLDHPDAPLAAFERALQQGRRDVEPFPGIADRGWRRIAMRVLGHATTDSSQSVPPAVSQVDDAPRPRWQHEPAG